MRWSQYLFFRPYTCHTVFLYEKCNWKHVLAVWLGIPTWSWAINSGWPCLNKGVGPDALQQSLPTPAILWFCSQKSWCISSVNSACHGTDISFFSVPVVSSAPISLALWFWLWNLNFCLENVYLSPSINCNLWLWIWSSVLTHKFGFFA